MKDMVNNLVFEEFLEITDLFLHNKNLKEANDKLITDLCNLLGIEKLLFGIKLNKDFINAENYKDYKGTPILVFKKLEGVSLLADTHDFELFVKVFSSKNKTIKHEYINLLDNKKYKTIYGEFDGLEILESLSYDVPYDAEPCEYFLSYLENDDALSYIIAERVGVKFTNSEFKMLSSAFKMLRLKTTNTQLEKQLSNESKVNNYILNNEKMPICMVSKSDQRILEYNDYYQEVLPNIVDCTYYYELIGRDKDFRIDNYLFIYIANKHWIKKIFSITLDNGEEVYVIYAKDTEEHIKQLENIDLLTTGLSLNGLSAYYNKTVCSDNNNYALITLDIANFKMINSKHSFETGNQVLCEISDILYSILKEDEMFCRINDDKFALLIKMHDINKDKDIIVRYTEINDKFLKLKKNDTILKNMTMYFGACIVDKTQTFNTLIDRSTMARKQIKDTHNKIKTIAIYDSEVEEMILKDLFIEERTPYAIENDEFAVYLQPKFDILTNKVVGAEALIRWVAYDDIIFYPHEFIPLFEKNGFISELDFIIIEKVMQYISNNIKKGLEIIPISINISKVHILSINEPRNFIVKFLELLNSFKIPNDCIEIELQCDELLQNEDALVEFINLLNSNNIKVCVDNFARSYSSINLLTSIEINTLKIDRTFLLNLTNSNNNKNNNKNKNSLILKNIISISNDLDFDLVCVGIENQEQLDLIKTLDCKFVQGNIFSTALSIVNFEEKFLNIN